MALFCIPGKLRVCNPPVSASQVASITGLRYQAQHNIISLNIMRVMMTFSGTKNACMVSAPCTGNGARSIFFFCSHNMFWGKVFWLVPFHRWEIQSSEWLTGLKLHRQKVAETGIKSGSRQDLETLLSSVAQSKFRTSGAVATGSAHAKQNPPNSNPHKLQNPSPLKNVQNLPEKQTIGWNLRVKTCMSISIQSRF